jgi:hypothetical protein
MTNRNTILNELSDIGSALGNYDPQNIYAVPTSYFERLPTQVLNRIKALEATNAKEELEYLSPLLSGVSKETPYSVPAGFFQNLSDDIMQKINEQINHQTSEEEIESLSPLLSSLKNKNPYSVPGGYFENLGTKVVRKDSFEEQKEAKVISITKRKWYRLAVAAVFIGVIAIGGLLFIGQRPVTVDNPQAWINKNVTKKVSQEKIDEFVKLAEDDTINTTEESDATKQAEMKELMKDVSEKEIEDFLNDAVALESKDTDALMN